MIESMTREEWLKHANDPISIINDADLSDVIMAIDLLERRMCEIGAQLEVIVDLLRHQGSD